MHLVAQVKVQTVPGYAKGLTDGLPKMINEGGVGSLYKGLVPLWARQIPYTMMKFGAPHVNGVAFSPYCIPRSGLVHTDPTNSVHRQSPRNRATALDAG